MKRILLFVSVLMLFVANSFSQVTTYSVSNKTVSQIVQQYLIGPNITLATDAAHPSVFQGQTTVSSNQIGFFKNNISNLCDMPMDSGLVITTCGYNVAQSGGSEPSASPNMSSQPMSDSAFYYTYTKYCIEEGKTIASMKTPALMTFWIKPNIDNFQFSYCFGSDEYPTYVNSTYNDFFGFYFSGPYDSVGNYVPGATAYDMQNLALVPGTQTSVMINTVNHGSGYSHNQPHSNPEYHIVPTGSCSSSCGFNEYTTKLPTASTFVIAGAYYKITIGVCNIGDESLQSGLFISKDMRRFDTVNVDTTICENQEYYLEIADEYLTQTGKYSYTYTNLTGGDSLINIDLKVNPVAMDNYCWTLKADDSFEVDDKVINAPGTYIFKYQTWLGCDSTVVYNVEWGEETMETDCVSGIDKVNLNDKVKVYPNPAKDILYIQGVEHDALITILDVSGKQLKQIKASNENTSIDISDLQDGIYLVNVIMGDNNITRKISKQ